MWPGPLSVLKKLKTGAMLPVLSLGGPLLGVLKCLRNGMKEKKKLNEMHGVSEDK